MAGAAETTRIAARIVDVVILAPSEDGTTDGTTDGPLASTFPARWRVLALRRAAHTRCTGAWEIVHGRIEAGERPAEAACREVFEETGFTVDRLYSLSVNPFYLSVTDTVQLAVVYAAVLDRLDIAVRLSEEHDAARWLTAEDAQQILAWPREHEAVRHAMWLLRSGDAGAVEDVLLTASPPPRASAPAPVPAPPVAAPDSSR